MISYTFLISIFFISVLFNFLLVTFGKKISLNKYKNIQNIHTGFIPRISILNFLPIIIFINFYLELKLNLYLLITFIIIIPAFIEDLGAEVKPIYRFILMIFGSIFLVLALEDLPQFNFGSLNIIANNMYFQIIFYSLALATVTNGQNIIDGTNGLSGLTALTIFGSLFYLGVYLNDQELINITTSTIVIILAFLVFNYPSGKIFLGDSSCYLLGSLAGYLTIKVFGDHPELPTWSAVIILYYPTLEVIFSYFRKLKTGKSPFLPDNKHLHLKIYFMLSNNKMNIKKYNSLVAPFLSIIWLTPFALLPVSIIYPHLSMIVLILLILLYIFIYFSIPEPD